MFSDVEQRSQRSQELAKDLLSLIQESGQRELRFREQEERRTSELSDLQARLLDEQQKCMKLQSELAEAKRRAALLACSSKNAKVSLDTPPGYERPAPQGLSPLSLHGRLGSHSRKSSLSQPALDDVASEPPSPLQNSAPSLIRRQTYTVGSLMSMLMAITLLRDGRGEQEAADGALPLMPEEWCGSVFPHSLKTLSEPLPTTSKGIPLPSSGSAPLTADAIARSLSLEGWQAVQQVLQQQQLQQQLLEASLIAEQWAAKKQRSDSGVPPRASTGGGTSVRSEPRSPPQEPQDMSVSVEDGDGTSGVGLAAAAALSAAAARVWVNAASRQQQLVSSHKAGNGGGPGHGRDRQGRHQKAGYKLIASLGTDASRQGTIPRQSSYLGNSDLNGRGDPASVHFRSIDSNDHIFEPPPSPCSSSVGPSLGPSPAASYDCLTKLKGEGIRGMLEAGVQTGKDVQTELSRLHNSSTLQISKSESAVSDTSCLAGISPSCIATTIDSSFPPASQPPPPPPPPSSSQLSPTPSQLALALQQAALQPGPANDSTSSGSLDPVQCVQCEARGGPKTSALTLQWLSPPRTVLVVCKLSPNVQPMFKQTLAWLRSRNLAVYVEPSMLSVAQETNTMCTASNASTAAPVAGSTTSPTEGSTASAVAPSGPAPGEVASWQEGAVHCIPDEVAFELDFVVVLGGDGTLLWTCHLFGNRAIPPLVPFSMGSLGFLTPFSPKDLESTCREVLAGDFPMILRHRLHCTIARKNSRCGASSAEPGAPVWEDGHCTTEKIALNEVVIDRGISPFLTNLQAFCNGTFITHVQGDGLIVSTPTGSTAYNLAAGGSMLHPQVPGILFTPICPHSLSFRPLVFPDHVNLCVQVPEDSRAQMYCSFDGKDRMELNPGDAVIIRMSQWPVPTVCSKDPSRDWFSGVREGLHWNTRRVQAGSGA